MKRKPRAKPDRSREVWYNEDHGNIVVTDGEIRAAAAEKWYKAQFGHGPAQEANREKSRQARKARKKNRRR